MSENQVYSLKNQIEKLETDRVSKLRSVASIEEMAVEYNSQKQGMTSFIEEQFANSQNLRGFLSEAKNVSKLRALISDSTCETPICAGVVDLYISCNPDLFNITGAAQIACEGKAVKLARKGKYTQFATPQLYSSLATVTNITNNLRTQRMQPCVLVTPKVLAGIIENDISEVVCGDDQTKQNICFTINTLDEIVYWLGVSSNRAYIDYLDSVATNVPASGSIKDVIDELITQSNNVGTPSSERLLIVNQSIIDEMQMAVYVNTGIKLFPNLGLVCGTAWCNVYCYDGLTKIVAFSDDILPKSGVLRKIILTKYAQLDKMTSTTQTYELTKDLAMLLNGAKTKVMGHRGFFLQEISQFAGTTTFKSLI